MKILHVTLKKQSCIYRIRSLANGRCYIGSCINFVSRKSLHKLTLKNGKHHNIKLQRHFLKHGLGDLVFDIVKFVDPADLIKAEQYYMDTENPWFNICKVAGSCLGRIHTKTSKKKISDALIGVKHTIERRLSMSIAGKGKKKAPFSLKHRLNMSAANKGKKRSPQTKEHIAKRTAYLYGNTWNKGKQSRNTPVVQFLNGNIVAVFKSVSDASLSLSTTKSNIIHAIKGRTKTAKGYEWKYKKDTFSYTYEKMV